MKHSCSLCWLASSAFLCCLSITSPTQAQQIVRDTTLPKDSIVTPNGKSSVITGGTQSGPNLFHSFKEFSVPIGGSASFQQVDQKTKNVISRVTGSLESDIKGLIEVLQPNGAVSSANLFLLNPNGIIFGPNASLNIGGSFLASTASSLNFADKTQFSATEPQATPLLTVSVPVGLQFGVTPRSIRNESQAISDDPTDYFFDYPVGLQVQPGKTLALVGNDVALEGGYLTAEGGRIELGSVASGSLVSLNPTDGGWSLTYEGTKSFQDIQLSQGAFVDVSGKGSGDINVQGKHVTLTGESVITAYTESQNGGEIFIRALQLDIESFSLIETSTSGLGKGGNVVIETGKLFALDGGQVKANTSGGQGGDLTVRNATDIELVGNNLVDGQFYPSGLLAEVKEGAEGPGGNLTIEAGRLLVQGGALVSTITSGGQGGDLTVRNATEVELVGSNVIDGQPFSSGLFALTNSKEFTGAGGNISISTDKLVVRDGAQVSASTLGAAPGGNLIVSNAMEVEVIGAVLSPDGQLLTNENDDLPFSSGLFASARIGSEGNGGSLTVETDRLSLRDGAVLQTSTLGAGNAGDLTVQASESVELIGRAKNSPIPGGLLAVSGGIPGLPGVVEATGQGGDIDLSIDTGNLLIQDGAAIAVSSINPNSDAKGAGSIEITAPTISLEDGDITAATESGDGGNITLQVPNVLLLRRNSKVSTSAGSAKVGGDGGDIRINTNSIVAVPQENSDITANAFSGSGGNVDIEVQGDIFGLEPRSRQELQELLGTDDPVELNPDQLPSNDITAISQTNPSLSGDVTINTPDVDPSEGVVALPDVPVNVTVAQGCQATGSQQASVEFFNTGKGGLPPNPYEPLSSSETWEDVPQGTQNLAGETRTLDSLTTPSNKIVEAQGWLVNEKGEAVLVAEVPNPRSQHRCQLR